MFLYFLVSTFILSIKSFNIDIDDAIVIAGDKGTHFGYSALMLDNDNGKWVVIGAPKANISNDSTIDSPGNVFKCKLNLTSRQQDDCKPMDLRTDDGNLDVDFGQNGQLLSSSMTVIENIIVVCAPLWNDMEEMKDDNKSHPIGRCFKIDQSLETYVSKEFSTQILGETFTQSDAYNTAQIGFSISPKKYKASTEAAMIMGAPGLFMDRGGIVQYNAWEQSDRFFKIFAHTDIFDQNIQTAIKEGSLLGYSIYSGDSSGKTYTYGCNEVIVLGAPHYMSSFGIVGSVMVVCAVIDDIGFKEVSVIKQFMGEKSGCGYGASLVFEDINNDGLDDLLVGAPLYFDNVIDGGAVYIYYGDPDGNVALRVSGQTLKGEIPFGRFGTAMQYIGDINKDHFNDIAIGAPYEDENRGTVYIYHGGGTMLEKVQTIRASDIDIGLRSFGWYISTPFDIDNNNYTDFLVGSYMSDHVTVLRARPIIKLDATLDVTPTFIPLNSSGLECQDEMFRPCTTITICFSYSGDNIPSTILVSFNISSDTKIRDLNRQSRVYVSPQISMNGTETDDVVGRQLLVTKDSDNCVKFSAVAKEVNREFFSSLDIPLEFKTTYGLDIEAVPGNVKPIIDNVPVTRNKSVQFSNGCSGTCHPDLNVMSELNSNDVILGSTSEVVMTVHVTNTGELALGTQINISMSTNTKFIGYLQPQDLPTEPISCQNIKQGNVSHVQCDMRNTFFQHLQVIFKARFLVSRNLLIGQQSDIESFRPVLAFLITADSSQKDVDPSNNKLEIDANVKLYSAISFDGLSTPEQLGISENADTYLNFFHDYNVHNIGPSPLYNGTIQVCIPTRTLSGKLILTTDRVKLFSKDERIRFTTNWPANLKDGPVGNYTTLAEQGKLVHNTAPEPQTLHQDSDTGVWDISCSALDKSQLFIVEVIINFLEVDETTAFTLSVNISEEPFRFTKASQILFKSRVSIIDKGDDRFLVSGMNTTYEISSEIYPREVAAPAQKINLWVVIGGSIGGLILLILLGVILWKCGFFKRKKKKHVQQWKRQSGYYARRSTMRKSAKRSRYEPVQESNSKLEACYKK